MSSILSIIDQLDLIFNQLVTHVYHYPILFVLHVLVSYVAAASLVSFYGFKRGRLGIAVSVVTFFVALLAVLVYSFIGDIYRLVPYHWVLNTYVAMFAEMYGCAVLACLASLFVPRVHDGHFEKIVKVKDTPEFELVRPLNFHGIVLNKGAQIKVNLIKHGETHIIFGFGAGWVSTADLASAI